MRRILLVVALLACAAPAQAAVTLPDGRSLTPAGRMVAVGDFPASVLVASPTQALTDTTGSLPNAIVGVEPNTLTVTSQTIPQAPVSTNEAFWAQTGHLALSADGQTLYASAGHAAVVDVFAHDPTTGALHQTGTVAAPGFVGGVAAGPQGSIFVTLPFDDKRLRGKGDRVARLDPAGGPAVLATVGEHPWDIATGQVGGRTLIAVADRDSGTIHVLDTDLHTVAIVDTGRQPAAPTFTGDGRLLFVSTLDDRLGEADPLTGRVLRRVLLRMEPRLPGAEPSALAVSPDERAVYVALSGDNAIAVVRRPPTGRMRVSGRIPTADYPTGVALAPGSAALLVSAGKGIGEQEIYPPGLPVTAAVRPVAPGTSGLGVSGVMERIALPTAGQLEQQTAQVLADDHRGDVENASPAPGVRHVVYVIRENKTYDEELGDEPGGAPALALYPKAVTPNAHALAEGFSLMTRFFADEEVSDTGHQAVMGGQANDWVERTAQQAYGLDATPRPGAELGNSDDTEWSPGSYLLDDALHAGITFRDYGEFYREDQAQDGPALTADLDRHIVHGFPGFGFDLGVSDTTRIAYWRRDFANDVAHDSFPALEVIYLPEDHTTEDLSGTPQGQVADADVALGQLVDSLSHSPYWKSTALLMTEDDPQSGLDHVDQHRTVGLAAGGLVARSRRIDAHLDQTSMLRTVELLLGLPPLTEIDATAPALPIFSATPDLRPFDALTPTVPAIPPARLARLHRAARAAIPRGTSLADVAPHLQYALQARAVAAARP